jgi:hypothetical protein
MFYELGNLFKPRRKLLGKSIVTLANMYYLIPNPVRDYGGIWHSIQGTKQTVEGLLKYLKAQCQRVM